MGLGGYAPVAVVSAAVLPANVRTLRAPRRQKRSEACVGGRYQRPLFAREVGIPCARGRYSRPFLRGGSVFLPSRDRYRRPFLRERSLIISRVLRLRARPQGAWWAWRRRARYAQRGHRWARQDSVLQKRRIFLTFAPRPVWSEHGEDKNPPRDQGARPVRDALAGGGPGEPTPHNA